MEFRFKSFQEFFAELGPRPTSKHSVDRIDVNGHYEPGNIRWATRVEQAHNQQNYGRGISEEIARRVKAQYAKGVLPHVIAKEYDISRGSAYKIGTGRAWAHL